MLQPKLIEAPAERNPGSASTVRQPVDMLWIETSVLTTTLFFTTRFLLQTKDNFRSEFLSFVLVTCLVRERKFPKINSPSQGYEILASKTYQIPVWRISCHQRSVFDWTDVARDWAIQSRHNPFCDTSHKIKWQLISEKKLNESIIDYTLHH